MKNVRNFFLILWQENSEIKEEYEKRLAVQKRECKELAVTICGPKFSLHCFTSIVCLLACLSNTSEHSNKAHVIEA